MTKDNRISIKQYEQAADEKVSLEGIKWLCKWDVCVQCDSEEEAEALRARLSQLNDFNPDWDAMAVMVEEQQRMAKRIEELTQLVTSQGIRLMDAEAQPEQEPQKWTPVEIGVDVTSKGTHVVGMYVLMPEAVRHVFYSQFHPAPQREWVGLTDEEIDKWNIVGHESLREFVRAIEAKLKENNGY